jgi:hypothetical protein
MSGSSPARWEARRNEAIKELLIWAQKYLATHPHGRTQDPEQ